MDETKTNIKDLLTEIVDFDENKAKTNLSENDFKSHEYAHTDGRGEDIVTDNEG